MLGHAEAPGLRLLRGLRRPAFIGVFIGRRIAQLLLKQCLEFAHGLIDRQSWRGRLRHDRFVLGWPWLPDLAHAQFVSRGVPARCDGGRGRLLRNHGGLLALRGGCPPHGLPFGARAGGVFCPGPLFGRPLGPLSGSRRCGLEPRGRPAGAPPLLTAAPPAVDPGLLDFGRSNTSPRHPGAGRRPRRVLDPTPRRRPATP